ncbi:hypothetical protein AJ79_04796 [Helicocarpus griseus UAMH5409]|uniref:Uncharacterized protein n=1 Tax=Helicocarpus griseus UAMH5409 TaxID=1447875 RepID=A0A2B7XRF8_9EURO|nr:hypothetical protein AJ79_04796 [Helicocarpus griseus UAMH5409]
MSGTEKTFHTTKEDIRKAEAAVAGSHGGKLPKDTDISAMKSVIDSQTDKAKVIEERKANLPLPEQPPAASDLKSADIRTTGGGSGARSGIGPGESETGLQEPATADSGVRTSGEQFKKNTAPLSQVGREGKEGLEGLPKDARSR